MKSPIHREEHHLHQLYQAFDLLQGEGEFARFFEDLCTPNELEALADRWRVARLVEAGHPYRLINEESGVSTATITRVARCISYGAGGYRLILDRLKKGDIPHAKGKARPKGGDSKVRALKR